MINKIKSQGLIIFALLSSFRFFFCFLKLYNFFFFLEYADYTDELFQFDGVSRPSSISYSNNVRFVADNEISNSGRKVLLLDGKKNYAKVSLNNFLQEPSRDIDGFTVAIYFKTSRLNTDKMYFLYGNGLEMFTLSRKLIIKYQTDDKDWTTSIPNIKENKWYMLNITWNLNQGLKVYVNNVVS